jgi:hypothetical protein
MQNARMMRDRKQAQQVQQWTSLVRFPESVDYWWEVYLNWWARANIEAQFQK